MPDEAPVQVPPLASEFPTVTYQDWEVLVAKVMNRGRPEDRQLSPEDSVARLRSTTTDGIQIEPLYAAPDNDEPMPATGVPGMMPFTRGSQLQRESTAWDIRVYQDNPDAKEAAREILTDLEGGASSIWLRVGPDGVAPDEVTDALAEVKFEMAGVYVNSADNQDAAAGALVEAWGEAAGDTVSGGFGIDPFQLAACRGGDIDMAPLVKWTKLALEKYPNVYPVSVDGRPYHQSGGGTAEELAFIMATAVEYLRELEANGVAPADVFDRIEFRVVVDDVQFVSIAKLRALRRLWARIGEALEIPENKRGARTFAVTSPRMMTRDDPYVNILRTTVAAFAAAAGNADAMAVMPFDTVIGLPDAFSRRIARNTQVILAEESNLGRVADPGGGSFYIESLTDQIAEKAWEMFQKVEAHGGMRKALEDGFVHEVIDACKAERDKRLANRSHPLTGVSEFPNLDEGSTKRPARKRLAVRQGAVKPFLVARDSVVFERLRDRANAPASTPTALLVGLGTRRDFGAREGFAMPFLNAGGIRTELIEVTAADQIADRVLDHPSAVAVVCTSPKVNGQWGGEAVKALRAAGVKYVYLAGNPKELGDDAEAIDGNIAVGANVVEITSTILSQLGVPELAAESTSTQGAGA